VFRHALFLFQLSLALSGPAPHSFAFFLLSLPSPVGQFLSFCPLHFDPEGSNPSPLVFLPFVWLGMSFRQVFFSPYTDPDCAVHFFYPQPTSARSPPTSGSRHWLSPFRSTLPFPPQFTLPYYPSLFTAFCSAYLEVKHSPVVYRKHGPLSVIDFLHSPSPFSAWNLCFRGAFGVLIVHHPSTGINSPKKSLPKYPTLFMVLGEVSPFNEPPPHPGSHPPAKSTFSITAITSPLPQPLSGPWTFLFPTLFV